MNQSLFSALQLEKMAVSITIGLIVMVAALNIVASLVLMVMEKSRDIAILKTMGATRRSISIVFMLQGTLIGLAGTVAGVALGLGLSFVLDRYKLVRIPTDVYQIAYVPFAVDAVSVTVVALAALLICFLATIYRRARRRGSIRRGAPPWLTPARGRAWAAPDRSSSRRSGQVVHHAERCDRRAARAVADGGAGEMVPSSAPRASARARCCTSSAGSIAPSAAPFASPARTSARCPTTRWSRFATARRLRLPVPSPAARVSPRSST